MTVPADFIYGGNRREGDHMPYASKRQERDARGVAALYIEVPVDMRAAVKSMAKAEDRTIGYIVRRSLAAEIARSGIHTSNADIARHEMQTKVGAA